MAFNAMKLRMALKDESEHQDDENYLVDVSDVFTRGILRDMGSSMRCSAGMGSCNRAQLPKQSYGLIYARLTGIASSPSMSAFTHIVSAAPK